MSPGVDRDRGTSTIPCPACDHGIDASEPWPVNHGCPACSRQLTLDKPPLDLPPRFLFRWLNRRDVARITVRQAWRRGFGASLAAAGCCWVLSIVITVACIVAIYQLDDLVRLAVSLFR